jgi:hypothetical protein
MEARRVVTGRLGVGCAEMAEGEGKHRKPWVCLSRARSRSRMAATTTTTTTNAAARGAHPPSRQNAHK